MLYEVAVSIAPTKKDLKKGRCEQLICKDVVSADCPEAAIFRAAMLCCENTDDQVAKGVAAFYGLTWVKEEPNQKTEEPNQKAEGPNQKAKGPNQKAEEPKKKPKTPNQKAREKMEKILKGCRLCIYVRPYGDAACCPSDPCCTTHHRSSDHQGSHGGTSYGAAVSSGGSAPASIASYAARST